MLDAVIISDLHLGSRVCQSGSLLSFLDHVPKITKRLILNGDVFNSADFRWMSGDHWRILKQLRSMNDVEVVWLAGNHDRSVGLVFNVTLHDEYRITIGDKTLLILHGDRFDKSVTEMPWLSHCADMIYQAAQWVDSSHKVATWLKHGSKRFLANGEAIMQRAIAHAAASNVHLVACGHTHHALVRHPYYNSGCWTESGLCSYLGVVDGTVELHWWKP